MKQFQEIVQTFFRDPTIKRKTLFTLAMIFVFRFLAYVPVGSVDMNKIQTMFAGNQFLSLLDVFSGGTLLNFSMIALGLAPYINASIIIQVLSMVIPQLEELKKEGGFGNYKINQYTRFLTLPIALVQSVVIYTLLKSQNIVANLSFMEFVAFVVTMVTGTFILMWIGELITEMGIGNGISVLIFAGIVARLPVALGQAFSTAGAENATQYIVFAGMALAVVAGVVFINEATRRVPVYYARRIKGGKQTQAATSYLPFKLNQAGVIPIIFAIAFVMFPQLVANALTYSKNPQLAQIASQINQYFAPHSIAYNVVYFALVFGLTYFYTMVVFNPQKISEDIQKQGGFIPGVRPGSETKKYLEMIVNRLTAVGGIFLGLLAIMPALFSTVLGNNNLMVIGGTSLLIVVSVVLETFKKAESQLSLQNYNKFIRS